MAEDWERDCEIARGKRNINVLMILFGRLRDSLRKLRKEVDARHALNALVLKQGSNLLHGNGPPVEGLGNDGDIYLDAATGNLFVKESD